MRLIFSSCDNPERAQPPPIATDHLGSTSLTADADGNKVLEIRYKAWGEVRATWTSSPSTTPAYKMPLYQYTGQAAYLDYPLTSGVTEGFGLMFYNARWYDPTLGRFAQADTIVPGGAQGLDRYAYTNNNPLNYTDPTGHSPRCSEENPDDGCTFQKDLDAIKKIAQQISDNYKNVVIQDVGNWNLADLLEIFKALNAINGPNGFNGNTGAFIAAFGDITFVPVGNGTLGSVSGTPVAGDADYSTGIIRITPSASADTVIHEMGHIFDGNLKRNNPDAFLRSQEFVGKFNMGLCTVSPCYEGNRGWMPSGKTTLYALNSSMEDFADSFLAQIKYGPGTRRVSSDRLSIIQSAIQSYIYPIVGEK